MSKVPSQPQREFAEAAEMKFDVRLIEKKVEHGFLTRQERDSHIKALAEETDYAVTSMDEIMDLSASDANS